MSRLMVSNLPKYYTEDRFRKDFSEIGVVTDSKIIKLSDGTSRRFGFVGFKTDREAKKALKHFNNTYVDTCKIRVEQAVRYGDDINRKVWSKHTKVKLREAELLNSNVNVPAPQKMKEAIAAQIEEKKKILRTVYELEKDPKAKEVLDVMRNMKSDLSWMNETPSTNMSQEVKPNTHKKVVVMAVPNRKSGGTGLFVTKSHSKFDSDSDSDNSEEYQDIADTDSKNKDKPDQEQIQLPESGDVNEIYSDENDQNLVETAEGVEKAIQEESVHDIIMQTGRLFITNISYTCTEEELIGLCEKYGAVREAHIVLNKKTKQSSGMAFVRFLHQECALHAFSELQRFIFQGRVLCVHPGHDLKKSNQDNEPKTFKQKRSQERKNLAGESFNWASFLMNMNTVSEVASAKLGINKGEFLDTNSDNVAVRLTLAETNMIQDAKQYLVDNGVNIEALEIKSSSRSNSVIIVKNIPPKTSTAEIEKLFCRYGNIRQILIPPNSTIAIVSCENGQEARVAFSKLAYSRFKDVPLFLEWAPQNIFSIAPKTINPPDNSLTSQQPLVHKDDNILEFEKDTPVFEDSESETDDNIIPSVTLYVTNLNFKTTEADLGQCLDAFPGIRSVKIATKTKNKSLARASLGFGFIEFESVEFARSALAKLNNIVLHDHKLQFKISNSVKKPLESNTPSSSISDSSKLVVRNVPFQASKHELRELFKTFGELKSLRIPRKMDGQHRGFAFVEYITKQDAKLAFNSLKFSHLYGRHLVLEWALGEDGLDSLRQKTANNFSGEMSIMGQQRKRRLQTPISEE